ncbi:MAG: M20/M25/M40 family metallo-hydrolase [Desulfobacteraceae bacterium]|nr:MAG: M20/M25/M40 family metallo-hydrolase [Desulfobacteraceae bacterium]
MINRQRLAETFMALVAIDSESREESGISDEIRQMLSPVAFEMHIDKAGEKVGGNTGNLIVKIQGNTKVPPLMLNAHMDTVTPGKGIRPRFENGVFTSDGTTVLGADDKSAVAVIIEVAQLLHENNLPHGPVELVFTICEEIGLMGAKNLDFGLISAKYGYALDTADTEVIVTRAPSANRMEFLVHGRDAHAGADPEKGINAILLASKAIAGLALGRIDHETTCNIGVIEGRGASNIVPNLVQIKGEARSHDDAKLETVTRNMAAAFEGAIADYKQIHGDGPLPRVDVHIENDFRRTHIPEDHPVVVLARQAAANLGRTLASKTTGGGADANVFFQKGIITGVIGTGMRDIHTVRESIRLDDMVKTAELLLEIIDLHSKGSHRS